MLFNILFLTRLSYTTTYLYTFSFLFHYAQNYKLSLINFTIYQIKRETNNWYKN